MPREGRDSVDDAACLPEHPHSPISPPPPSLSQALGDVVVFLCFGPLLVQFTALLVAPPAATHATAAASWTEHIHWDLMPYTVPLGLLTGACVDSTD